MARGQLDAPGQDESPASHQQPHSSTGALFPAPTVRETATILSVPTLLFLCYFLVQPVFDAWRRLGYVREPVARRAPATRVAPESLAAHADAWHELTRLSHALIHQPSGTHTHILGNVVLITLLASALLVVLTALGRRSLFALAYWELVVVAPLVGSFAFDRFGQTAHGYGASTIGFAFLGVIGVAAFVALLETCLGWRARRSARPTRSDGGWMMSPALAGTLLLTVLALILFDVTVASPATPVHQAGVVFGALLGTVVVLFGDTLGVVVNA